MSVQQTGSLPTPHLKSHTLGPKNIIWWGMIGLITIETVVVGGLIGMYLYLKLYNPAWPPDGIDPPHLLLPIINTAILLASGVAMRFADQGGKNEKRAQLLIGQGTALLLASTFLVIKVIEYGGYDYDWTTHAYGSMTYALTIFHSGHVLSVVLKGLVVFAMAARGMFTRERRLALEVNGLYWQFIVLIWLPIFATLYLAPYL